MTHLLDHAAAEETPVPGAKHLASLRHVQLTGGTVDGRSGSEGEQILLILTGTHDVFAGGGSWIGRGLRKTVFEGRPCGIFLPAGCPWRLAGGTGEALLVGARVTRAEPMTPKDNLAQKVLLPIAGSGKAWDPETGDWKRQEDFPLAPEAILPRRITVAKIAGREVEFVFPASYKARAMCMAETRLGAGESIEWPDWRMAGTDGALAAWPHESLYFLRTEGEARLAAGGRTENVRGDGAVFAPEPGPHRIDAVSGRCYVAAFFAGPEKQRARIPE